MVKLTLKLLPAAMVNCAYKGVIKVAGKNGVEPIAFEGKYQALHQVLPFLLLR